MAKDNQPGKKIVDPLMKPVQDYLEKRAAEDPQFAEKFSNPKKSLEECCRYIYGRARKLAAGSSCLYVDPQEVFGWAVHYYDEADLKVTGPGYSVRATVAAAPAPKPVELTAEQKAAAEKAALEKYEADQRAKIEAREKQKAKAEAAKRKAAREEAERRKAQEAELNLFNLMGI